MRGLKRPNPRWIPSAVASLCMSLTMIGGAGAVPTISAAAAASSHMIPAIGTHPDFRVAGAPVAGSFSCQQPGSGLTCYGPQQIRNAYNIQPLLNDGVTGKHRTIVIIDAFGNPYIRDDLKLFDSTFGLPDPTLNILYPDGQPTFDITNSDEVGWSGEISLDVQWSHAVAPGATIDLVISKSDQDADILSATKYAIEHNLGDVISQSFGEGEVCMAPNLVKEQHALFAEATRKHITLFASSGDSGAAQPDCNGDGGYFLSASTPASDPYVTAVGGTNLYADLQTGAYHYETAWNDGYGESGGGFSVLYSRPEYQEHTAGIPATARGVPDVAYNAGVNGGVLTHWGVGNVVFAGQSPTAPLFFIFGGTSAGSPQWSGITALADQAAGRRLGFLNDAIYNIGHSDGYPESFHDITVGNNIVSGVGGYTTTPGWDPVTGWGTPKADRLVKLLIDRIVNGSRG